MHSDLNSNTPLREQSPHTVNFTYIEQIRMTGSGKALHGTVDDDEMKNYPYFSPLFSPRAPEDTCPTHIDHRYACLALGNLAVATVNHEEILAAKGLEGLSSALDCDDHETVFNACYALNKLAMSEANHEVGYRMRAPLGV